MVDVVFADVAQPDQARIMAENCHMYLKNGGKFLISLKANCIDSTNKPEVVFANEVNKLKELGLKPKEQLTLEPYERDHAMVLGTFRWVISYKFIYIAYYDQRNRRNVRLKVLYWIMTE